LLAVAILFSAAYGWFLYRQEKNHLDENLSQIKDIYIPRLVSSLWVTDYESLQNLAVSMAGFKYVEGIQVRDNEQGRILIRAP